ncbi:MAG: hypothetical protein HUU41_01425 [Bryobacteraceae bacterium]|nr:hypothetical protein [Bryobacterales bacterium]NUM99750.1 hypothetical protein [Bryobacteraceae bacterium]
MRYRFCNSIVLGCCAFLMPAVLSSQTEPSRHPPYIAVSKRTIYIAEPGKPEVLKDIVRKTEARDSQGRRYSSGASIVPERFRYDWVRDFVAGRSYQVNRQQKVAYFTSLDPTASGPDPSHPEMQAAEINGVRCLQGPTKRVKPDGGSEVIGTTCVSPELGILLVYEDIKVTVGGENLRMVSELENMQMDTEPPAEWFQIPPDYRLIPGHPGRPKPID